MGMQLSDFEKDVISLLLSGENEVLSLLRTQFQNSVLVSRDYSDVGLYLDLEVPDTIPRVHQAFKNVKSDFCFGDVLAMIPGMEVELGFLIWITSGAISTLEGFTFGEELPEKITAYELSFGSTTRDLGSIKESWKKKKLFLGISF